MLNNIQFHKNIALLLILGHGFVASAQTKTYKVDVEKSQIEFKVKHLGVLNVEGSFKGFEGSLIFSGKKLFKINSIIKAESIDTNDEKRDETLRDSVYFNVIQFPDISFNSSSIEYSEGSNSIKGILKIKNVERTIDIPFQLVLRNSGTHALIAETIVVRKEFGLDFGAMDALVGNKVKVRLEIVYSTN
ncbi:MAG: YceI family protein [Flavobacteriaceae bacterium]|nr:YceI family protein [Bacteroidia bacterium]NNL61330.1 YceI family protein [Flavobacteriaceae bacterium]